MHVGGALPLECNNKTVCIDTVSVCTLACNLDRMTRYLLARMLVEAAQSGKGYFSSDRQRDLTNREMSLIIGGVSDPISWGQLTSQSLPTDVKSLRKCLNMR
jgi:hypothetical protein